MVRVYGCVVFDCVCKCNWHLFECLMLVLLVSFGF